MIGYSFFEEKSIFWRKHQGAIIPLSMPHSLNVVTKKDAKEVLKKNRGQLIRWESNFNKSTSSEWWHIIKDTPETIENLNKKVRYTIKKGCANYRIVPCECSFIVNNGYTVYKNAFQRYKTFERVFSECEFKSNLLSLPKETEFWAVFEKNNNKLVAFSENLVRDNACFYVSMWYEPESLKNFASYALFHEMNKHYLNERKLAYVSDGARSISHQTGIHEFLISKFGFRKAYADLNVIYQPVLSLAISAIYPLHSLFKYGNWSIFQKISIVLEQERIRRSCLKKEKI